MPQLGPPRVVLQGCRLLSPALVATLLRVQRMRQAVSRRLRGRLLQSNASDVSADGQAHGTSLECCTQSIRQSFLPRLLTH